MTTALIDLFLSIECVLVYCKDWLWLTILRVLFCNRLVARKFVGAFGAKNRCAIDQCVANY